MEATKTIAELKAEMQKILQERRTLKANYKERLQNVVKRLPKNYASIAAFITNADKNEIYNVRQGRKQNPEILAVLEQIADDYQNTLQKDLHNQKNCTNNFVTNENNYQENCNVIADLQENLHNLQKNLHNPENFTNTQNPDTQEKNTNNDTEKPFVKKVSLSLYNNIIKNNLDIEKESKERKQKNKDNAKLFKDAFPDFQTFKNMLPEWDELTAKHWYEQAEYWSNENNAKKKDWIKTVQIWNKRNPLKYIKPNTTTNNNNDKELKIKETQDKIKKLENDLEHLRILWKERPHQREYINQEATAIQNQIKRLQKYLHFALQSTNTNQNI